MQIMIQYAMRLVGLPYKWGGSNPLEGYDCSGLVQELLLSAGIDPEGDQTAQGLFDWFDLYGERDPKPGIGVLCFYGKNVSSITHVSMMLDPFRVIEAGSGGPKTHTFQEATAQGAFVRIRHISGRKPIAMRKPRYSSIGLL
jgi:cell wall-associated NlpC family hydrolase